MVSSSGMNNPRIVELFLDQPKFHTQILSEREWIKLADEDIRKDLEYKYGDLFDKKDNTNELKKYFREMFRQTYFTKISRKNAVPSHYKLNISKNEVSRYLRSKWISRKKEIEKMLQTKPYKYCIKRLDKMNEDINENIKYKEDYIKYIKMREIKIKMIEKEIIEDSENNKIVSIKRKKDKIEILRYEIELRNDKIKIITKEIRELEEEKANYVHDMEIRNGFDDEMSILETELKSLNAVLELD